MNERRLYVRTALSKQPRQLLGVIDRKLRNRVIPRLPIDFDGRYRRQVPDTLDTQPEPLRSVQEAFRHNLNSAEQERYRTGLRRFADGRIEFLNRGIDETRPEYITPNDPRLDSFPRLWFLKLSGFVPLEWAYLGWNAPDAVDEDIQSHLDRWCEHVAEESQIGETPGYLRKRWTPYAVSLRIVNWVNYLAWGGSQPDPTHLYRTLLFLSNNVEHDVGGNHLVENGVALVVGGVFVGDKGERFVEQGVDVLETVCQTQFLDDGYHFERSPMYHIQVLSRLLMAQRLLEAIDQCPDWLDATTGNALGVLQDICGPDRKFPLFNDAVYGETHSPETVLGVGRDGGDFTDGIKLSASGLHRMQRGKLDLLADFGASGPGHLLAHTHNDPLSYVLWAGSKQMICDTGVYEYEPNARREWARSVAAHNCAHPAGVEPAAYGDRFLMYDVVETDRTVIRGEVDVLAGRYTAGDGISYEHERRIHAGPDWFLVWDTFAGAGDRPIHSHIQLSPDADIEVHDSTNIAPGAGSAEVLIVPLEHRTVDTRQTEYFPEFGTARERPTVTLTAEKTSVGYLIGDVDEGAVQVQGLSTPNRLTIGDEEFALPGVSYE